MVTIISFLFLLMLLVGIAIFIVAFMDNEYHDNKS